jgi:L-amino acid N-acyltransferase YncA
MIRSATPDDAERICDIYNYYIVNTPVSFEEEMVSADEMRRRIETVMEDYPWYVYEENGDILGYSYATRWKTRSAYRFSSESTVYVKHGITGKGIGSDLYAKLLAELKIRSIHAVVGGIALPNEKSQALHEKFGFKKVAHFSKIGFKFGQWIDLGYWELVLDEDHQA